MARLAERLHVEADARVTDLTAKHAAELAQSQQAQEAAQTEIAELNKALEKIQRGLAEEQARYQHVAERLQDEVVAHAATIIALFVVYGIFFSMDEAQTKAFIADIEPERRATAIGVYNFVTGMIYLPASIIAGALWLVHASLAFLVAAFRLGAIIAFVLLPPVRHTLRR